MIEHLRLCGLWLAAVIGLASTAGCGYLAPHISRTIAVDPPAPADVMPQTKVALAKVEKWMVEVDSTHASMSITKRSLNLLTFGLVSASGVNAVRGTSTGLVRNYALGAGVTYTGASLFLPDTQLGLYTNAAKALACVQGKGTGVREAVLRQRSNLGTNTPMVFRLAAFGSPCGLDAQTQADFQDAVTAHLLAQRAVQQAIDADGVIGAKITEAAQNTIIALNAELDRLAPSPDAILAAARSATSVASGLSTPPVNLGPTPAPAALCAVPSAQLQTIQAELRKLTASYLAIRTSIEAQVNAVEALDTACTLEKPAVGTVQVNNADVTLAKDSRFVVGISGGTGGYRWTPVGAAPPPTVLVDVVGSSLIIYAKSTAAAGTFTISVQDRSAIPQAATLKVTVQ